MRKYFAWGAFLLAGLVGASALNLIAATAGQAGDNPETAAHRESILDWRQKRHERLAGDYGWLSLVGLEWLQEGENRVGSAGDSTIRLSGGPGYWGSVYLEDQQLRFVRANEQSVTVDGSYAGESVMVPDIEGEPTVVQSGTIRFYPIYRESYALRIKDSLAPTRVNFKGIKNFPIEWNWRIDGRFIPGEEGETIEIGNVLGQLIPSPVVGRFEFERGGNTYSMVAVVDEGSESLEFIFADRSNGHDTYGAGRFVPSEGMPENGRLIVDFNKAYNPPCAFNDYSTCPIPPQENRLNLTVTSGEKDFHAP
jgi:uncharacterized protein (DUF1684 family)